ncbi:MAG: glutaredoxin 2 [Aliivibrio sp.]|uniref:glutaredoxin 2 n=1 Tax=Aliivibrio sp. TaxID=1872443 RepID=UPI001A5EA277|nr:glutaredoxin 2 [Aliivibrio sp.]
MKLYLFDHCPYCIKAQLVVGIKKMAVELIYLQNDDVTARTDKVGVNLVPILEKEDGSYMAESLDIAAYLDQYDHHRVIGKSTQSDEITQWLSAISPYAGPLMYPRWMKIPLPEFQQPSAFEWFTHKKTAMIEMNFDAAFDRSEQYINQLTPMLLDIDFITLPSAKGEKLSWDDINFFPFLRNLTVIKGLVFPPHITMYLEEVSELTGVGLYFDVAV